MSLPSDLPHLSIVIEPNEQHSELVVAALREFNRSRKSPMWSTPPQPSASLELYALDQARLVVGGVIGRTNDIPEWCEVTVSWVAEHHRGHGLGRHLMALAEKEAADRGCRFARLATSDFQAPGFYRKLGYRLYGQLKNCPRGETVCYFFKSLV